METECHISYLHINSESLISKYHVLSPSLRLLVGTNFDDRLMGIIKDYPVEWFYGSPSVTLAGHGRSPSAIGMVDEEKFIGHVESARRNNIKFLYTMNALSLLGKEYRGDFVERLRKEMTRALEAGVSGFIVATPFLVDIVKREYPDVEVVVSSFSLVRGLREVEFYLDMGADVITIPEDANRDFTFLERTIELTRERGADVEVILNNSCLYGCPYRLAHECLVSATSSEGGPVDISFDYPILMCAADVLADPTTIIKMRWIRPEDLRYYERMGIERFKISSRGRRTEWIARAVRAYSERRYHGNLLDILTWQQGAVPRVMRSLGGPADFDDLLEMRVDNDSFPRGWLELFERVDCDRARCDLCRYCDGIAAITVTVGGKKLTEYEGRRVKVTPELIQKLADGRSRPTNTI